LSAHWMRRTPSGARARSFTSYRFVVAIESFLFASVPGTRHSGIGVPGSESVSCGQKSFVLALLPLERALAPGEPGVDRVAQRRLGAGGGGRRALRALGT